MEGLLGFLFWTGVVFLAFGGSWGVSYVFARRFGYRWDWNRWSFVKKDRNEA